MRLAFVALLITLFILAPVYLLPHLIQSDSGEDLVTEAARDIVGEMPHLSGVSSIAVPPFENDSHKALQFALVNELRRAGTYAVIESDLFAEEGISVEKLIKKFKNGDEKKSPEQAEPDAILTGRIQRDETPGSQHLMHFEAVLVGNPTGEVLWTTSWRASATMSSQEWEFKKAALLICLALAAGILIIYARMEDRRHGICVD
jgi:hypothetical protein